MYFINLFVFAPVDIAELYFNIRAVDRQDLKPLYHHPINNIPDYIYIPTGVS